MPVSAAPGDSREFQLLPSDNARLANLCGPLDENLRLLESRLDVRINRRGDTFRVGGARADSAESLVRELFELARTEELTPERVHLTLRERESGAAPQGAEEQALRLPRMGLRARGNHQREYLQQIHMRDLTFGIEPGRHRQDLPRRGLRSGGTARRARAAPDPGRARPWRPAKRLRGSCPGT